MKSRKIAILTFHRAVNYGAVLQAYALQHLLKEMGYEADMLDYRAQAIEQNYYSLFSGKGIITKLKSAILYHTQYKRNKRFLRFVQEYIKKSNKSYNSKTVNEANNYYDTFIVGSDQVWNLSTIGFDYNFFLRFVHSDKKKITYAASLGKFSDHEDDYETVIADMKNIPYISVREYEGKRFLNELGVRSVAVTVDPVFLVGRKKWEELQTAPEDSGYILVYSVNMNPEVLRIARKLKMEKNLPLRIITLRNRKIQLEENESNICASPEEFLGWINNSRFTVTNSFHGLAFSIIFNKEFYLVKNSSNDLDNSRLMNLLNILDLKNRIVCDNDMLDLVRSRIDYESVNEKIERYKKSSIYFLENALSE